MIKGKMGWEEGEEEREREKKESENKWKNKRRSRRGSGREKNMQREGLYMYYRFLHGDRRCLTCNFGNL